MFHVYIMYLNGHCVAETAGVNRVYPQIDRISYVPAASPPLTQRDTVTNQTFCRSNAPTNCLNGFCRCTHIIEIKRNELVEMVIVDESEWRVNLMLK
jgi:hypothetical protein